jgi:hypothetical protein
MRTILFTVNWLPFVIFLVLLARLADDLGVTDWGRIFVVASGCFATLMIPFPTTLNNHTVAACSAMFALYAALRLRTTNKGIQRGSKIEDRGSSPGRGQPIDPSQPVILDPPTYASLHSILDPQFSNLNPRSSFLLAGFFAGFSACSELPATSFLVSLFFIMLWLDRKRALTLYLPAAAIPIAFFFLTNYWAIGQLKPAYGEFGGPWYEYEGSHWLNKPGEVRHGIDFAYQYENKAAYAFHLLLGHHGLFSLTPIFLLGLVGGVATLVAMARGRASGVSYDPGNNHTGAFRRPARQTRSFRCR